jgi:glycosyltransferase involved in cell wall biosynthesis
MRYPDTMLPITAVVCTLNSINSIERCILGLKNSGIREIIVVDGGSTDGTVEYLMSQNIVLLFDQGLGLGAARNLGILHAKEIFILNCGSDNVMCEEVLAKMLDIINSHSTTLGVGCLTKVEVRNLLHKMLNIQWSGRITPGFKEVIGTPSLYRTKTLQKYQYSKNRTWSDDEELCTRIKSTQTCTFQVVDAYCLEVGQDNLKRLRYRFLGYGKSDFEIWRAYSENWPSRRKWQSIRHPIDSEFSNIIGNISFSSSLVVLPLLIFSTVFRYVGWIKAEVEFRSRHIGRR